LTGSEERKLRYGYPTNLIGIFAALIVGWAIASAVQGADQGVYSITTADFSEPQAWGAVKNVVGVKHLYISGQPDQTALRAAREHGVIAVINVRGPDELDWDEEAAVKELGMHYYNIPIVTGDTGLNADAVAQITRLVGQYKTEKILLHCASGNRASAWLAVHLVQDHSIPADSAIELAKHASLTKSAIETRVREFLGAHPETVE